MTSKNPASRQANLDLYPFEQGQLDGLCGIYSIINAIRLALARAEHKLPDHAWEEVFAELLEVANGLTDNQAVLRGADTILLNQLLVAATRHLAENHDIRLRLRRPLRARKPANWADAVELIREMSLASKSAIIFGLFGRSDHWTVVSGLTNRSLALFDSGGWCYVRIANCRLEHEAPGEKNSHVIFPKAVFLLTIRRLSRKANRKTRRKRLTSETETADLLGDED